MRFLLLVVVILVCTPRVRGQDAPPLPTRWVPEAMVSAEIADAIDLPGGEGGQWIRSVAVDHSTGDFVLWGTDVGGLFRSLDGGQRWEPCNVGYTPRGTACLAIDPNNPDRVLSVAANSLALDQHGIYLSEDQAASWTHVLELRDAASKDTRDQIAFDPSTFDDEAGKTTDVYWSRIADDDPLFGETTTDPALYKSTDGGETWTRLPDTAHLGGGTVFCHPTRRGIVYIGTPEGLYRSIDAGESFALLVPGEITGLHVSKAAPDSVWCIESGRLLHAPDGERFTELPSPMKAGHTLRRIRVSPADASRMVLWRQQDDGWDWTRWYSHDGGKTWAESTIDNDLAFLPQNERQHLAAWHPADPNVLWAPGGDWPTKSTDGGATYRWSARGVNNILPGGLVHPNTADPDVIFFGSQDYNGAVTTDSGATWQYVNPTGNSWGGFTYAGYAVDERTLIVGLAEGWSAPLTLATSHDGGTSWTENAGVRFTKSFNDASEQTPFGLPSSYGSPRAAGVAFFGPWRTTDGGRNWSPMTGCDGVLTHAGNVLYGVDRTEQGSRIVQSANDGRRWVVVTEHDRAIRDVAVDAEHGRIYFADEDRLRVWQNGEVQTLDTPTDQLGNRRVTSVAVDPFDPDVVYLAQHKNIYASDASVCRSTDGGRTWQVLTRRTPLTGFADAGNLDGGREAIQVFVHPRTRDLWVITGCYGVWRYTSDAAD